MQENPRKRQQESLEFNHSNEERFSKKYQLGYSPDYISLIEETISDNQDQNDSKKSFLVNFNYF